MCNVLLFAIFRSTFECNCWFAEDAADGRINRTFNVTSREERTRFSSMYKDSMHNQVTDSHLWVSVFVRPSRSNFTRAQRLTSAVAILFLSMITSAMFYKSEDGVEKPMQLKLGPFSFSTQELFVSVVSKIITERPIDLVSKTQHWKRFMCTTIEKMLLCKRL